jgi:hypothetical protein
LQAALHFSLVVVQEEESEEEEKKRGGGVKSVSLVKASLPSQFALKHISAWLFALRLVWFLGCLFQASLLQAFFLS